MGAETVRRKIEASKLWIKLTASQYEPNPL